MLRRLVISAAAALGQDAEIQLILILFTIILYISALIYIKPYWRIQVQKCTLCELILSYLLKILQI